MDTENENEKKKKKKRNRSSGSDSLNTSKVFKPRGPSESSESSGADTSVIVSEVLNETNSILYNLILEEPATATTSSETMASSDNTSTTNTSKSESTNPSNSDIMNLLLNISQRLGVVEKKLCSLESLEKKVENFDSELKRIWRSIEERHKKVDQRLTTVEEKSESVEFAVGQIQSQITDLENKRDKVNEDLLYLQSQSMRNNLLFTNIPESTSEGAEETERKLRAHIHEKMRVAKEVVDNISFERVHRTGVKHDGKIRNIVAKFSLFKERELVRRQWKTLKDTPYSVFEQFPKEIVEKRRRLRSKVKEHKEKGDDAWIAYDTLYVNGRPVKE